MTKLKAGYLAADDQEHRPDLFKNRAQQQQGIAAARSWRSFFMGDGDRQPRREIEVIVGVRGRQGHDRQFRAVYNFIEMNLGDDRLLRPDLQRPEASLVRLEEGHVEQPVLVRIVQKSKDGKKWRDIGHGLAAVWLDAPDCVDGGATEAVDVPRFPVEILGAPLNRERELGSLGGRTGVFFVFGDRVDQVIEGGSRVVDAIGCDEGPSDQIRRLMNSDRYAVPGSLSVSLTLQGIRLLVHPGTDSELEAVKVLFRPSKLGARTERIERAHEDNSENAKGRRDSYPQARRVHE